MEYATKFECTPSESKQSNSQFHFQIGHSYYELLQNIFAVIHNWIFHNVQRIKLWMTLYFRYSFYLNSQSLQQLMQFIERHHVRDRTVLFCEKKTTNWLNEQKVTSMEKNVIQLIRCTSKKEKKIESHGPLCVL